MSDAERTVSPLGAGYVILVARELTGMSQARLARRVRYVATDASNDRRALHASVFEGPVDL
jgi:hypothetical protein